MNFKQIFGFIFILTLILGLSYALGPKETYMKNQYSQNKRMLTDSTDSIYTIKSSAYFKESKVTLNKNDLSFEINLNKYISNKSNNKTLISILGKPTHLNCNLESNYLNCKLSKIYSGTDRIILQLTDKSTNKKSKLELKFNLNHAFILPKFKIYQTQLNINEDSFHPIDLANYIDNPENLDYTVSITNPLNYTNATCSIVSNKLDCNFPKNYSGVSSIEIKINESNDKKQFIFNILPVNDAPEYNYQFPNGEFLLTAFGNYANTFDLSGVFNDVEKVTGYEVYNYQFVNEPKLANCSISGNILSCLGIEPGTEDIIINVIDNQYILPLKMKLFVMG